jgi:hypothetical protein
LTEGDGLAIAAAGVEEDFEELEEEVVVGVEEGKEEADAVDLTEDVDGETTLAEGVEAATAFVLGAGTPLLGS